MTIEDLLSFGLVEVGICRDDLLSMSVGEFVAMQKTYIEKRRSEAYDRWDRLRTLAAIVIQPHCKRKITPRQLLPLPGDKQKKPHKNAAEKVERSTATRFSELVGAVKTSCGDQLQSKVCPSHRIFSTSS